MKLFWIMIESSPRPIDSHRRLVGPLTSVEAVLLECASLTKSGVEVSIRTFAGASYDYPGALSLRNLREELDRA